jgi:hypothetical protein
MLQTWLAAFKAVRTAEQAYNDALNSRLNVTVAARTQYKAMKAALKQYFGSQSGVLASFGIGTDKPIELTTTQQLVAVANRKQTRAVRGTKGKAQLAAITVVGNPSVSIASDGTMQVGDRPVNLPGNLRGTAAASSSSASGAPPGTSE